VQARCCEQKQAQEVLRSYASGRRMKCGARRTTGQKASILNGCSGRTDEGSSRCVCLSSPPSRRCTRIVGDTERRRRSVLRQGRQSYCPSKMQRAAGSRARAIVVAMLSATDIARKSILKPGIRETSPHLSPTSALRRTAPQRAAVVAGVRRLIPHVHVSCALATDRVWPFQALRIWPGDQTEHLGRRVL
jgi:hypothetical protein